MQENLKVIRTRKKICSVLTEMLEETAIEKIAITELCRRAGINRTTFYNHYGSQYHVLEDLTRRYLDDIGKVLADTAGNEKEVVHARVTMVFRYMEEHLKISRLLINSTADPSFPEALFSLERLSELIDENLKDIQDAYMKKAVIDYAVNGSFKLIREWLNEEERMPADQMAGIILLLSGRVCGR